MPGEPWGDYETAVLVISRALGWEYEKILQRWPAFFERRTESSLRGKIAACRTNTDVYDLLTETWRIDQIHTWVDGLDMTQTQKDYCHRFL